VSVNIVDISPEIFPEVPGCPALAIKREVRSAAIEFCLRSKYWRADLTAINSVASQGEYTLTAPTDSVFIESLAVKHNDILLEWTTERELDEDSSTWRTDTSNQASSVIATAENKIMLYPAPESSVAGVIKVKVVLKPSTTATTLPSELRDQYLDAITAGTKSRLMAMPGQAWSNPQMSVYYRGVFDRGIDDARMAVAKYGAYRKSARIIAKGYS